MKPNILFLLPDQWRGDWWSGSGHGIGVHTPTLESLAGAGTVFHSATSPSPLCAPARACIASGRRYEHCGVASNKESYPRSIPTIYQAMQQSGYHVMGCGKFDLHKPEYSWGPDGRNMLQEWGFSDGIDSEGKIDGVEAFKQGKTGPYLGFLAARGLAADHVKDFDRRGNYGTAPTILGDGEYCDNWIVGNAGRLLEQAPAGQPWFMQVNFTGPHFPYDITCGMDTWYKNTDFPDPYSPSPSPGIDHLAIRRNYAAMIQNIDAGIARILDHPRVRAERQNTIIVFSSDHGEMLGDRGLYGKCVPFNGSIHVPLIVAGPGIQARQQVDTPVDILDLAATFIAWSGSDEPEGMDSVGLSSLLGRTAPENQVNRPVYSALSIPGTPDHSWRMMIDEHFKYIRWTDGREQLFSRRDYFETSDLVPRDPGQTKYMRTLLEEVVK